MHRGICKQCGATFWESFLGARGEDLCDACEAKGPRPLRNIAMERHAWFMEGREAFARGEPISNSPRSRDTLAAKRWRDGWLSARETAAHDRELGR